MLSTILSISLSNPIIIAFVVVMMISMAIYLIHFITYKIGKNKFEKQAKELVEQINTAQQELETMYMPTHLLTNKDIEDFQTQHQSLLANIEVLKKHKYYNEDIFEKTGIASFMVSFADSKVKKEENNKVYNALAELKDNATKMMDSYRALLHPSHYFAHSELEDFIKSHNEIKDNINFIFPQYAQFVTDDDSKQLPSIILRIEIERTEHNKKFIKSEIETNKLYFDHVLGTYPLDPQQRDSIVKLEDNCLVIASAGSGKTSTIVGKVKYLVEKQHINPTKILILTYTKKAANELSSRIQIAGLNSGTFHSLAYHIIAEVTGQTPSICNADVPLNVFRKLIMKDEHFLNAVNNYVINCQSLMKLEHDYIDAFAYFEDRKKYGIQALFPDIDGKVIFTRSEEEKRLCSILTRLGLMFRYECDYPINTRTPERRQYKPDFTIYFKDRQGQWQRIYLEHFAIDKNGKTPRWFGEGTKGGWKVANKKYIEGIDWKRNTHRQNGTVLIETTSADFHNESVEQKLIDQLSKYGVAIRQRTDKELYDMLIQRNHQMEKTVFTLLLSFITLMKANEKTIDGLLATFKPQDGYMMTPNEKRNKYILTEIVKPFFEAYQTELEKNLEIDFTDAIIQATALCRDGLWKHYDYILVDEFQDISIDRYKLLQALRSNKPKTKLYCVGDDWQSIFRFAGSDMALFYDFEQYFGFTELCKIETTYRFHQPLIDKSSAFIMKNPAQKEKNIKTPQGDLQKTFLNFVKCNSKNDGVLKKVEEIVMSLPINNTILLMGRYNYDAMSIGFKGKIDYSNNHIKVNIAGRDIFFLSIHSAKGIEADHVILINCNQGAYGFPSLIEDDPILDFVLSRSEQYPFAEERRLFYVAMTRAKKRMYILYDQQRPSPFICEFLLKLEIGSRLCPKCLEGKIVPIKDGTSSNGISYRSFTCTNNEAGCDFFETRFGDLTPPGILVTENMTAQDIEHLRENRRHTKQTGGHRYTITQQNRWT
ncbi:MAG: UvrD-helicase domain-containing protein [Bacteroidaceae bacterium]|nr:UvrD-helicase domain-containing protein [Bacteroidaceae bacterium]